MHTRLDHHCIKTGVQLWNCRPTLIRYAHTSDLSLKDAHNRTVVQIDSDGVKNLAKVASEMQQLSANAQEERYIAGINPAIGKDKRKSVYAKTKAECAKKLREATAAVDKGTYLEPEKIRVSEWMRKWLDTYCKVKPRTKETYESAIDSSIIPEIGNFRLCELKPAHIQDYINGLEARVKRTMEFLLASGWQAPCIEQPFDSSSIVDSLYTQISQNSQRD